MSDLVERVARALAKEDGIQICDGATYALSSYRGPALAAIAAMQTDAEPVAYWYKHPTQMNAEPFGTVRLTPADKADGWTETPLYAHPPIAAKDAEIAALQAHADVMAWYAVHQPDCRIGQPDCLGEEELCTCGLSNTIRAYEEFRRG